MWNLAQLEGEQGYSPPQLAAKPELCEAKIDRWLEEEGLVEVNGSTLHARTAVSCLVVPRAGDRILLCQGSEQSYVLSVLARENQPADLVVPGATELSLRSRKLQLEASEEITLKAPQGLFDFSGVFHAIAGRMSLMASKLMTRSRERACYSETSIESCEHRSVSVSGVDLRCSKQTIEQVEESMTVRAKIYLAGIKDDIRMTAKRILFS